MRAIQSLTSFAGSLITTACDGNEGILKLERPSGEGKTETDLVVLVWEDEAQAQVAHEQLQQFCIGKTILLIGDHLGTRSNGAATATSMMLEELRIISKTFREAVVEAAAKIPLCVRLNEVKDWTDFEKWFTSIAKGLHGEKFSFVEAEGARFPIARGTDSSMVSVELALPVGKTKLIGVTQSPNELNEWGEAAAKGKAITWFGFKVNIGGAETTIRTGHVKDGVFVWSEGAKEAMAPLFISKEGRSINLEGAEKPMYRNAADALAAAAIEQVRAPA